MVIYEEEGIKQSFRIILSLDGIIIKTHGALSETFREVYSRTYDEADPVRMEGGFLITDFNIGPINLKFDDEDCAKAIKLLIEAGRVNPQMLVELIGRNDEERSLEEMELTRLENYLDMNRFASRRGRTPRAASHAPIPAAPRAEVHQPAVAHEEMPAAVEKKDTSSLAASEPSRRNEEHTMFSRELENLIHAAIEDGVLEEYEKAALVKRASAEGVDLAELEIYINSLLQRKKRELQQDMISRERERNKARQEAMGPVCPNCGRQVEPLTLKCQCGYEFTKAKVSTSMQQLSEKLRSLDASISDDSKRKLAKMDAIKLMPVPNTKEDIIDFLALSLPNSRKKGGLWGSRSGRMIVISCIGVVIAFIAFVIGCISSGIDMGGSLAITLLFLIVGYGFMFTHESKSLDLEHNDFVEVWRSKFEQVLMKARSMRGDLEFQKQLDYYEDRFRKM